MKSSKGWSFRWASGRLARVTAVAAELQAQLDLLRSACGDGTSL